MDCQQVQNDLLSAESLTLLGPEMAAHLAECPQCQALLAKLRRLEAETRALPVPAGHEHPSPEFLRTLAAVVARSGPPVRHFVRRAIAAAVVLAFGLAAISLIFFNGSTVQADVLIGQLVDWNLSIAHSHDTAARTRIYQQQLQQLQKQVDQSRLSPADHELAVALLNNAQWLTTEENTTDESQHFQAIASQLLARQQAASDGAATHLQQIYEKLISQGVSNSGSASPSTTQQQETPAQTGPTSVLPDNRNSASTELKFATANAAPMQSRNVAIATPAHTDWANSNASFGDGSVIYPARLSGMSDIGSSHVIGEHSHRIEGHSAGGESLGSSSQTSHTPGAPAAVVTTVQPAHVTSDSFTHSSLPSPLLPPPSHPCLGGGPPPPSNAGVSSLQAAATYHHTMPNNGGWPRPAAHWQIASDWSGNDSMLLNQDGDPDGSGLISPPFTSTAPISRHEIDAMLAEHINHNWTGSSDLMLPYPPPPMGRDSEIFFHLDDAAGPVPFPEPAMGFAIPLIGFALRRQRRIGK